VPDKPLIWLGSSREDVRSFPVDARRSAGFQLRVVQRGWDPSDWKAMASVGPGVREIRIHTGLEHRVIYIAKFSEGIYVLHGFEKKSRKTAQRDVAIAKSRLQELVRARRSEKR